MTKEEMIAYANKKGYTLTFEPVNQIDNGNKELVDAGIYPLITYSSYFIKFGAIDYDDRMMETINDFSEKSMKDVKKAFNEILKYDKKKKTF